MTSRPSALAPRPAALSFSLLLLLSAASFVTFAKALVVSTEVTGNGLLLAQVLQPTGLARGASLRFSYYYGATPSVAPPVLLLADEAQYTAFYRRGSESEEDFFNTACLAPAALRVELEDTRAEGAWRVPYTGQFTLLALQCGVPPSALGEEEEEEEGEEGHAPPDGLLRLRVDAEVRNPNTQGRLVHHLGLESVLLPR